MAWLKGVTALPGISRSLCVYLASSACCIIYAVLAAIRFPNLWSATQASWNYGFGIIKRGLMGEAISWFAPVFSYERFVYISGTILFTEVILMLWIGARVARALPWQGALLLSLFFLTPAFLYHVHTIGYLEHLLFVLAMVLLLLPLTHTAAAIASIPLCALGMLTHELFLVIGGPVLALRLYLLLQRRPWGEKEKEMGLSILFSVAVMLAFLLALHETLQAERLPLFIKHIKGWTDFVPRMDMFAVLVRSLQDNANINLFSDAEKWSKMWALLQRQGVCFLPTVIVMVWVAARELRMGRSCARYMLLVLGIAVLTMMPLVTILVAWDYDRIGGITGSVSYLFLLGALYYTPRAMPLSYGPPLLALLLAIGVSRYVPPVFMDGYALVPFPFAARWEYMEAVWEGRVVFPEVPLW